MNLAAATVYIVDDEKGIRDSLISLLETIGLRGHPCAGALEFRQAYVPNQPACVLLDVRLPEMNGIELLKTLADDLDRLPAIIMTGHADIPTAVEAMKHGAMDFVEKPVQPHILLELVQKAMRRSAQAIKRHQMATETLEGFKDLTQRERDVFEMVAQGASNKHLAKALKISERTVEYHRSNLMKKMKAESLAQLVRKNLDIQSVKK